MSSTRQLNIKKDVVTNPLLPYVLRSINDVAGDIQNPLPDNALLTSLNLKLTNVSPTNSYFPVVLKDTRKQLSENESSGKLSLFLCKYLMYLQREKQELASVKETLTYEVKNTQQVVATTPVPVDRLSVQLVEGQPNHQVDFPMLYTSPRG